MCLQLMNNNINPQLLLLDFEVGAHTTVSSVFENIPIKSMSISFMSSMVPKNKFYSKIS